MTLDFSESVQSFSQEAQGRVALLHFFIKMRLAPLPCISFIGDINVQLLRHLNQIVTPFFKNWALS